MEITEKLDHFFKRNESVIVSLKEASNITGSGLGKGGRYYFDNAFYALRQGNPLRGMARMAPVSGKSVAQFAAKTGNGTGFTAGNPWGYAVPPQTTTNVDTVFWQRPVQVVSAIVPVRTAVWEDVNALGEALMGDLALELGTLEGISMLLNDQTVTNAGQLGGANGLSGIKGYAIGTAAYGTSGTNFTTNGNHTIQSQALSAAANDTTVYSAVQSMLNQLPAPYWQMAGTAWMMHPSFLQKLRNLRDGQGLPLFLDNGLNGDGDGKLMLGGFPVIINGNLDSFSVTGVGNAGGMPCVLANWPTALEIVADDNMVLKNYVQTNPGFFTVYGEHRVASSIRDPFGIVRMNVTV